jgi:hypothetical protein
LYRYAADAASRALSSAAGGGRGGVDDMVGLCTR